MGSSITANVIASETNCMLQTEVRLLSPEWQTVLYISDHIVGLWGEVLLPADYSSAISFAVASPDKEPRNKGAAHLKVQVFVVGFFILWLWSLYVWALCVSQL